MGIKIILSFLSVLAVFFISFVTFSNDANFNMEDFSHTYFVSNWIHNLYKDKNSNLTDVAKSNNKSDYKYEKFDSFDKIFFSKESSYDIKYIWNNPKITLKKGKYFLYFTFPRTYYVSGEWFSIKFNWPIKLYIDTEENNILSILPLNNYIDLTLIWLDDKEEKTISYIYPHMFFSYKLNLNKILSNTDYFRISQINTVNYIRSSLYINDGLDFSQTKQLDNRFFKDILTYFDSENLKHQEEDVMLKANYDEMKYAYISKHFNLLVNKSKKSSYYKDLIFMDLSKIYSSEKVEKNAFKNVKDNFKNLKEIDPKWYEEMKELLAYFNLKLLLDKNIIVNNDQENYEKKSNYNLLLWEILWYKQIIVNDILYCVFDSYDSWDEKKFFEWIIKFSHSYLSENGMEIKTSSNEEIDSENSLEIKEERVTWFDSSKSLKMGYYITFLENIIKSNIETKFSIEETNDIFSLLNEYSLLTTSVFSIWDDDKRKTLVAFHLNLLKELETYLKDNFFETDLDRSNLLVIRSWVNLDNYSKFYLEKAYNNIYNFYESNKNYFDENNENDKLYLREYEEVNSNISDYITALKDYNKYRSYKLNLINNYSGSTAPQKQVFTDKELTDYFHQFAGVSSQWFSLKKQTEEKYYVVLFVSWKKIEFEFFPYDNFLIKWVTIDWKNLNLSYSLKTEEEKYKKMSWQIIWDDVDTNFANFFVNKFLMTDLPGTTSQSNPNTSSSSDDSTSKTQDDVETMIFKRDVLFAPNQWLSKLKDFSNISNENVLVTFESGNRNIKLQNVRFAIKSSIEWDNNIYWAYMDSEYDVEQKNFNNIKLKVFKQESEQTWEVFWLWETKVEFMSSVKLDDLRNYLNNFFSTYNNLTYVWSILNREFSDVNITFNSWRLIKYSFTYKSRNFDILLLNNSILSIKQNWNSKLDSQVPYTSIEKYINLLIK